MASTILRKESPFHSTASQSSIDADFEIGVGYALSDPNWDAFLKEIPGGLYTQSSLWAQTKAVNGWRVIRVTATRQGSILGGAQILVRSLPLLGCIGYVPGGPVFAVEEERVQEATMQALLASAKRHWCHALLVQPARSSERLAAQLPAWGMRQTSRKVMPEYTLLLDLTQDSAQLSAQMKPKTRYNTRVGPRKGLALREGTPQDFKSYHRLLEMTSQRQHFKISSEDYYAALEQIMWPQGNLKLFVAEYGGEMVSAQLAIPFGDTVVNKMTVWSGTNGHLKPNEALMSMAITWSKEQGYHYYDFGGMSSVGAKALLQGEELPEKLSNSVTSFKLGFGGHVVAFPKAHVYFSNPLMRWADAKGLASLENGRSVKKLMHILRTR
jgi:lipid II:glycine glycyltransferase (peptidoglycan interpeptide bridge formation enzyme)